ncbi:unnamed protein product [Hermetia illucens]|uniref:Uncharacterized protein n=1 Tax=Hermetia illucens TaxID=343691 RepID=A0A7R8UW38_HERIL|nr:unnamed protein product [Hermetia illucens]
MITKKGFVKAFKQFKPNLEEGWFQKITKASRASCADCDVEVSNRMKSAKDMGTCVMFECVIYSLLTSFRVISEEINRTGNGEAQREYHSFLHGCQDLVPNKDIHWKSDINKFNIEFDVKL